MQIVEVLSCCVNPIIKTHLIRETRMTWGMTMPLCEFLEAGGYLERIKTPCSSRGKIKDRKTKYMYLTTQKGREALKLINGPVLTGLFDYDAWRQEQKEAE